MHTARPDPFRARARQYVFRARRDRQRIAQALAAGAAPEAVAAVERIALFEVEKLLADRSFAELVVFHRELRSLDPASRQARLGELATDLLELALLSGDLRVAMFVRHELSHGRNPGDRLVAAIEAVLARAGAEAEVECGGVAAELAGPTAPAEPRATGPARADDRHFLPDQAGPDQAGYDGVPVRRRRSDRQFDFCAATMADADTALGVAECQSRRVEAGLRLTAEHLATRLLAELERQGTGWPRPADGPAPLPLRPLALGAMADPQRSWRAAAALDAVRTTYAEGIVPALPSLERAMAPGRQRCGPDPPGQDQQADGPGRCQG